MIQGKKVLVFGLGVQGGGMGDAKWLGEHGAIVKTSDSDLNIVPEGQTKEQIDWAEIIIKNPGVADDHELIKYAQAQGIPVFTSIAVFVKYSEIPVIGITGTRGKSTTTALITALLESVYPGEVISGGNIPGTSGLSLFDLQVGKKFAVLELSSFQLHNFHELQVSPHIAVVTNLYPDHLNRYANMDDYRKDKEALVIYQTEDDYTLVNQDNEGALLIGRASHGQLRAYSAKDVSNWETTLKGEHNRENIAAMAKLASVLKIDENKAKQVVANFHGVPFRLETIRTVGGVTYINDTTSTTPTAAIKAISSMDTPFIWITGGESKRLPFTELVETAKKSLHLKKIIILGSAHIPDYVEALSAAVGEKIVGTAMSMAEAIDLAKSQAVSGDTVLLSPGFSSFDLFQNEFDRGRQFNDLVNAL